MIEIKNTCSLQEVLCEKYVSLGNQTHDLQITERNWVGREELPIAMSRPLSGSTLDPWLG